MVLSLRLYHLGSLYLILFLWLYLLILYLDYISLIIFLWSLWLYLFDSISLILSIRLLLDSTYLSLFQWLYLFDYVSLLLSLWFYLFDSISWLYLLVIILKYISHNIHPKYFTKIFLITQYISHNIHPEYFIMFFKILITKYSMLFTCLSFFILVFPTQYQNGSSLSNRCSYLFIEKLFENSNRYSK